MATALMVPRGKRQMKATPCSWSCWRSVWRGGADSGHSVVASTIVTTYYRYKRQPEAEAKPGRGRGAGDRHRQEAGQQARCEGGRIGIWYETGSQ
jgi:hypothetical protein